MPMKAFLLLFLIALATTANAQISQCMGNATTFGVLSSTYTNTVVGTFIDGNLGYTTGPATSPIVIGTTHVADAVYAAAGVDQATAQSAANATACTFNFSVGAIDLHSNPFGTTYPPGVYCIYGAMSIGGGGIIFLNGTGIHLFKSTGAFTTSPNSQVILNGTDPCDVFWYPGFPTSAATTLGANTVMVGTIIDPAGITVGSTTDWIGRALAFGGTVTTDVDTIIVPSCPACTPPVASPVAAPVAPPVTAPTTPSVAPTATPTAPSAPVAAPTTVLSPGAIAGIVIGSVVFALIIIAIIVYCCVSYQRDEEDYEKYR
jgi:hypothetical protein